MAAEADLELDYFVVDVFTETPLAGNPLAVVVNTCGLETQRMQAIAREFNLSETTFVERRPAAIEQAEGVRVRIFTTQEELPFAGHPTLGTASWLWLHHPMFKGAETITLRLNVGPIVVRFGASETGVDATMQQLDPVFGAEHDPAEVAGVIGMSVDDLLPGYAPQTVSTGNAFCIVVLRSVQALSRLAIPQREAMLWLKARGVRWFYCIAPMGDGSWRARMQFYGGEDPATGSAAGPCIAWLVMHGLAESEQPVVIEQGVEMLRPSRITAQASRSESGVHSVCVSGRTIPVARGSFFLP
jgi:trans-2,3-dihydro-3-hydroxyanthranilate isomerase